MGRQKSNAVTIKLLICGETEMALAGMSKVNYFHFNAQQAWF